MKTTKLRPDEVQRRALLHVGLDRRAGKAAKREKPLNVSPSVLDAVRDQHDELWVRYGKPERACWILVSDFARPGVFARLARIDPRLIELKAQRCLQSEIARITTHRPAIVAASPGWIENHFVFGDGEVLSPRGNQHEVIVTFEPHPKFVPRGTLDGWQAAIGPIVTNQSLALFSLSLGFVGPLMPFVPPDYLSPFFEFVGAPGCGKSALGVAAMSIHAGNPGSSCAGGETWNLTPGRFDAVKLSHRHVLLLLDEANSADSALVKRRELVGHAIFSLADTGARQRLGDPVTKPHAQLAVLSTSNRRLSDLIEGSPDERAAMHERLITIPIADTRAHGVLDHVPPGFANAAQAVEALRAAADEQWGTAGPAFVDELQREAADESQRLRGVLARSLAHHRERMSTLTDRPRVQKCFALVAVAGLLARRWGILPAAWGCPGVAVLAVAREAIGEKRSAEQVPMARIRAYAERHRSRLCHVSKMEGPLSLEAFEDAAGFLIRHKGRSALLVPARHFQREFPDHRVMMSDLRRQRRAHTEGGGNTKLTIKTPKAICDLGRVYCVYLD